MFFKMSALVTVLILLSTSFLLTMAIGRGLSQIELRAKYGQVDTTFNDGKSCYRTCVDGEEPMDCFYEFHVQFYDTMNSRCGNCVNGTLKDCCQGGCVPGNGVERVIMTVNQQLPGQAINVCEGDRIIVDVTNHMPGQGLSMHWHGMRQERTPWMDGVSMVTQCPISSGSTFRYAFFASHSGSNAYHAHSGYHRVNGIAGPLIIRQANDPNECTYDYDFAEHTVLLYDWGNYMAEDNIPGAQSMLRITPSSVMINGRSSYHDFDTNTHKFAPMAVFYVQRGKRHRFRFVNTGSHPCPLSVTIGGHKLTIIATDGGAIEPMVVDSFACSAGERYDVVLDATRKPNIAETLMTVRALGVCVFKKVQEFARIVFVDNIFNYTRKIEHLAPLPLARRPSYDSAALKPTAITLNYPVMDCKTPGNYCIASVQQKILPNSIGTNLRNIKPYKSIPLYFDMITIQRRPNVYLNIMNSANVATINSIVNAPTPLPVLTQDDSHIRYCNAENLPDRYAVAPNGQTIYHCPHLIPLKLDKVYEFILIDNGTSPDISHPIHIHADPFQVIDMGTKEQLKSGKSAFANAKHPPVYKDTVSIPPQGYVIIRIRTSNPGYWMIHCHLDDHMKPGMMLIMKVGEKIDMQPPPADFPTCGNYLMPVC